jgi:hypothetical protein
MRLQVFTLSKGLDFGKMCSACSAIFLPVNFVPEWNFTVIFFSIMDVSNKIFSLPNFPQKHVFLIRKLDLRMCRSFCGRHSGYHCRSFPASAAILLPSTPVHQQIRITILSSVTG